MNVSVHVIHSSLIHGTSSSTASQFCTAFNQFKGVFFSQKEINPFEITIIWGKISPS